MAIKRYGIISHGLPRLEDCDVGVAVGVDAWASFTLAVRKSALRSRINAIVPFLTASQAANVIHVSHIRPT